MSRRSRILFCVGFLAVVAGVAIGVLAMLPPRPGVTRANFDRIKDGMTPAEVEQILGPADDEVVYDTNDPLVIVQYWERDKGRVAANVCLTENKRVFNKTWVAEKTFLDKLRRWLHLPK